MNGALFSLIVAVIFSLVAFVLLFIVWIRLAIFRDKPVTERNDDTLKNITVQTFFYWLAFAITFAITLTVMIILIKKGVYAF